MADTSKLEAVLRRLKTCPVVPVLSVSAAEQAAPLARALEAGGITVIEMTLRTPAGLGAIATMKETCPDLCVGAGTVLSAADVRACESAGADFLVSPGADPALLAAMAASTLPAMPGVATPGEALGAAAHGLTHLKLFPAEIVGGIAMLSALYGPLPHLSFMPTGGVTLQTLAGYLALPNVHAVGGTWIAKAEHVVAADWSGIGARAREARRIADAARPA